MSQEEIDAKRLEKLFFELEKSIEKKQYRLSRVICDAILAVEPTNLAIISYIERIPEATEEETKVNWSSLG